MDTEAPGTSAIRIDFTIPASPIALVLAVGLLVRLWLATLPGFETDLGLFQFWSRQLADSGPWDFYDVGFFVDYAPGYLYVLGFIGGLDRIFGFDTSQFEYVLKLPATIADLASAYLLYRMMEGQRPLFRLGGPALYLLFPPVLLIGPVWGQVDSILAFFLLLTVYFVSGRRAIAGAVAYTVAFLVKPQAVAALPFLAFWYLKNFPLREVMRAAAISLGAGVLIVLPFFPDGPWGVIDRLLEGANVETYRVTSFWAYNFWGLFDLFKPDSLDFWGLSYRFWGFFLFAVATALIILAFWRSDRSSAELLALGTAISVLAFYLFLTRMHERYLFPLFLPLLAACLLTQSRVLWAAFTGLGIIHFFNLYYVYSYYLLVFPADGIPVEPFVRSLYDWIEDSVFPLSLLASLAFPVLLVTSHLLARGEERAREGGRG